MKLSLKVNNFYNLIIALFALGVTIASRPVMVTALVLWLIYSYINKSWPDFKSIWQESLVKWTCLLACLYFVFLLLNNVVWHDMYGARATMHYAERMIPGIVALLMYYRKENTVKATFWGMLLGILFISGTAFYGYFILHETRANSILGQHNNLGGWIVVTMPLFAALTYKLRSEIKYCFFGSLTLVVQMISLYLSNSRGAMLALLVVVLVGTLLYIPLKYKLCLIIGLFGIIGIVLSLDIHTKLFNVAATGIDNKFIHGYADTDRVYLLKSAWAMFKDHMLWGVGVKNYSRLYVEQYMLPGAVQKNLASPHCMLLHYLTHYGIVGSLGFFALWYGWIKCQLSWLYGRFYKDCYVLGVFLSCIGFGAHGMIDCLHLTNFIMQIMWFQWAIALCYVTKNNR